jgi:hypothetical protein
MASSFIRCSIGHSRWHSCLYSPAGERQQLCREHGKWVLRCLSVLASDVECGRFGGWLFPVRQRPCGPRSAAGAGRGGRLATSSLRVGSVVNSCPLRRVTTRSSPEPGAGRGSLVHAGLSTTAGFFVPGQPRPATAGSAASACIPAPVGTGVEQSVVSAGSLGVKRSKSACARFRRPGRLRREAPQPNATDGS